MSYAISPVALSYEEHYRLCSTLSSPTATIVTAAPARLYKSRFDTQGHTWIYSGLKGIAVFGYDSVARSSRRHGTAYWFKMVDIRRLKVLWEHEISEAIEYEAEMPFFHAFGSKTSKYGLRFDEDDDAAIFLQEVALCINELPLSKPSSSQSTTSSISSKSPKSISKSTAKSPSSQSRPLGRSKISSPMPESFEHVAHMSADNNSNWNIAPEWSKLLKRLEGYGVDADMVEENFEFVKGFLAGAEAMRSTPPSPKMNTHPSPTSSRTASVESFEHNEHSSGYHGRDRRTRNSSRKPAPLYQY